MKHRELLFRKAFQEGDGLNESGLWWLPREAKIFGETVSLVKAGGYELNGRAVRLPDPAEMMRGAVLYTDPGEVSAPELPRPTEVDVIVSDSLLAGKRLLDEGYRPAVLVFANRQVPGWGWNTSAIHRNRVFSAAATCSCLCISFIPRERITGFRSVRNNIRSTGTREASIHRA